MALELLLERRSMNLDQAQAAIRMGFRQMDALYGGVVFDEWAVISLDHSKGTILSYTGPRKAGFRQNFPADAGALRTGLLASDYTAGDFEFERQSVGTRFESFMVLGEGLFLICNNTVQTMDAIAKKSSWLSAQVPFVELSEAFRNEPLCLAQVAERNL